MPLPIPEEALCRRVLARYSQAANPVSLWAVTENAGFSGARVWRAETVRGPLALRATPLESVNLLRLAGLHRLLRHVYSSGINVVAVPLVDDSGVTFRSEAASVWQLEPWQPGAADFRKAPAKERLGAAMQMLARWHRAAERFRPHPNEESWYFVRQGTSPGMQERRAQVERCDARQISLYRRDLESLRDWSAFRSLGLRVLGLYERTAATIARELELAGTVEVPLHPCLRDIWHDHVLFQGEAVTGLIDAHACRSDNVGTDLARLLGSLIGSDRIAWDEGIAAYQQFRPLSFAERGLLEVFDRSGILLSGVTWLEWVCREQRQFPQRERVEERLELIVQRLEQLAQSC